MDKRTLQFTLLMLVTLFGVNTFFSYLDSNRLKEWKEQQELLKAKEPVESEAPIPAPALQESGKKESLYVIETPYQQLVFSTTGGSLKEINLPLKSKEDSKSLVMPVQFDRTMAEDEPQNDQFPSGPYVTLDGAGKQIQKESGTTGGYYPLIRRSLIQKAPLKDLQVAPSLYALNIVSTHYPEVAHEEYQLVEYTPTKIVFESKQPYRKIKKTYTLPKEIESAPYTLELQVEIEGDSRGLMLTSGVPEAEWINGGIAPSLKYRITKKDKSVSVESLTLPTTDSANSSYIDWISNSNGFFGVILDPLDAKDPGFKTLFVSGEEAPSRLIEIDQEWSRFKAADLPGYVTELPFGAKGGTYNFRIYAGPFATETLKLVDKAYSNPETGYNPDYISTQTSHGWFTFISGPFSRFLFLLMSLFHSITGSWGFSIILLTVALRVMLYPLNAWSMKSMRKMQAAAPRLKAIQEKYKNDSKRMHMEIANLYRETGANPLTGCLPILIQIPFLLGMFDLLKSSFELRGAPFIPGWIDDLASPDVLFSWQTPIWFIGTEFHLLPILTALLMYASMRLAAPSKPVSEMTEQERTQRMMGTMMTIPFAVIFYNAPSGLSIYWIFTTLLGMAQQWWTNRSVISTSASESVPLKKRGK